ncbi:hypothetical protein DFH06DRAFT_1145295 [Mycena polygramma]|nr:hypothetical protein DFH06DRAFT_1145295 [Mycena polygramma]
MPNGWHAPRGHQHPLPLWPTVTSLDFAPRRRNSPGERHVERRVRRRDGRRAARTDASRPNGKKNRLQDGPWGIVHRATVVVTREWRVAGVGHKVEIRLSGVSCRPMGCRYGHEGRDGETGETVVVEGGRMSNVTPPDNYDTRIDPADLSLFLRVHQDSGFLGHFEDLVLGTIPFCLGPVSIAVSEWHICTATSVAKYVKNCELAGHRKAGPLVKPLGT